MAKLYAYTRSSIWALHLGSHSTPHYILFVLAFTPWLPQCTPLSPFWRISLWNMLLPADMSKDSKLKLNNPLLFGPNCSLVTIVFMIAVIHIAPQLNTTHFFLDIGVVLRFLSSHLTPLFLCVLYFIFSIYSPSQACPWGKLHEANTNKREIILFYLKNYTVFLLESLRFEKRLFQVTSYIKDASNFIFFVKSLCKQINLRFLFST